MATLATKDRLAQDLSEINGMPAEIVNRASQGYYDDYLTPLLDPKTQLAKDLTQAGFPHLAERVRAGEWDNTKEEAHEWRESEEGREALFAAWDQANPIGPTLGQTGKISRLKKHHTHKV